MNSQQPQQISYAYGGQEQEVQQLMEVAREEEDEQLVYEDQDQVQMQDPRIAAAMEDMDDQQM